MDIYIWLRVRMGRVKNDMDEDIENYYIWIYMAKSTDGKGSE